MFQNYVISAFRNLIRNKVQSIIQILSLALGLMVFILISLYTYDELTIDRQNENLDKVYRIEDRLQVSVSIATVTLPTGPVIQEKLPEVEHMTRIVYYPESYFTILDENGEPGRQVLIRDHILVDSGFMDIFPQDFLLGDPHTALRDPENIILTKSLSVKLFGTENPMGKTVLSSSGARNTVSGIIEDPLNTHLKFEAVMPIHRQRRFTAEVLNSNPISVMGGLSAFPTYITMHENADPRIMEQKIEDTWHEWCLEANPNYSRVSLDADITLCPLKDVHFSDVDPGPYMTSANRNSVMNLFLLGTIILLLGIINYINLATARASLRGKEICIKKIVGSSNFKLILYFLTESTITTLFSFLIALTCVQLFLPRFINILQADINLYFLNFPIVWIVAIVGILIIGLLSGLYPAFRMSSGPPSIVHARNSETKGKGLYLRRILMILQFSTTVMLMVGILIMHVQISQMKNLDLGFNSDGVVWTNIGDIQPEYRVQIMDRLDRYPEIEAAGLSTKVPGRGFTAQGALYNKPGSDMDGISWSSLYASPGFLEVYDLKFIYKDVILEQSLLKGNSNIDTIMGSASFLIANESSMKEMGLENPMDFTDDTWVISGVVKDFYYQTPQYQIRSLGIMLRNMPGRGGGLLSMRVSGANIHKTLRKVEKDIQEIRHLSNRGEIIPEIPVEFDFIDETFNAQYQQVQRLHDAFVYFFILAMIIACMGLFGLTVFMAQRRTKEIGIRKSMGSTTEQVFLLLAGDFTKWISISVLIGSVLGWYIMKQWQNQFAYKADIGIWVYLLTALIAFGIAIITVAWQSLKAAGTNPIESLRYE